MSITALINPFKFGGTTFLNEYSAFTKLKKQEEKGKDTAKIASYKYSWSCEFQFF